jgi:hypothetical protein
MKSREKILLMAFLLLLGGAVNPLAAQLTTDENLSRFDDRALHFGFYLGLNTMDYRFSQYNDVLQNPVFLDNPVLEEKSGNYYQGVRSYRVECYPLKPGFTVGGVVNFRMNRVVDFRCTPGMSLGVRQVKFSDNLNNVLNGENTAVAIKNDLFPGLAVERYMSTPSAYIDFPLGFRYKGNRFGNLRPYVYAGGAYRRDLENKRISESVIHLKRNGYYAEVAFGLDTYFPYFRFTGEFKFSYGLNNIIRQDAELNSTTPLPYYGYIIKSLNSNIFTLIFFFE